MQFTPTQKHVAAWMLIALLAVLALWLLGRVLTPFVVAAVLAYALTPLVDRLDALGRGRMPRFIAVAIVELLLILVLVSLVLIVVPVLAKEVPLIREQLPFLFDKLNATITPWLEQLGISLPLDLASIKAQLVKYLSANFEEAVGSVFSSLKVGGGVALIVVGYAVLVPVALFYLLLDWKQVVERALELVPPRARAGVDAFTTEADQVLGQYLRGQLLVMVTMAAFYSVGLALFGLDLAVPIGVFTGLAMFVPYVGFGIGLVLAIVAGILQFASIKALVMVATVYGAGQVIEGFYLTPRLVGQRIGLHPLVVIFALLAFAQLFGFLGVLVALPASAVLFVAIRRLRDGYMSSKLYQNDCNPRTLDETDRRSTSAWPAVLRWPAFSPGPTRPRSSTCSCGPAARPARRCPPTCGGRRQRQDAFAQGRGRIAAGAGRCLRAGWMPPSPNRRTSARTGRWCCSTTCTCYTAVQQHAAFAWFINAQRCSAACSRPGPCRRPISSCAKTCARGWAGAMCSSCKLLGEPERRAVLRQAADARGVFLGDEVMDFMLTRFARDLGT